MDSMWLKPDTLTDWRQRDDGLVSDAELSGEPSIRAGKASMMELFVFLYATD